MNIVTRDLLVDSAAHAGGTEEDRVAEQTDSDVDITDTSEKAVSARVEGLTRIPKDKHDKNDISEPPCHCLTVEPLYPCHPICRAAATQRQLLRRYRSATQYASHSLPASPL